MDLKDSVVQNWLHLYFQVENNELANYLYKAEPSIIPKIDYDILQSMYRQKFAFDRFVSVILIEFEMLRIITTNEEIEYYIYNVINWNQIGQIHLILDNDIEYFKPRIFDWLNYIKSFDKYIGVRLIRKGKYNFHHLLCNIHKDVCIEQINNIFTK